MYAANPQRGLVRIRLFFRFHQGRYIEKVVMSHVIHLEGECDYRLQVYVGVVKSNG